MMSMKQVRVVGGVFFVLIAFSGQGCNAAITPEQKRVVVDLKQDLDRIRQEIEQATRTDAMYRGGLIKTLIGMRLEVLKTNAALVEQRVHALESGARINLVVDATKPDPEKAAELAEEIESQRGKVTEARAEADRYSGGLVQAMAAASVATNQNTLAMLEQRYFVAKYGLAMPTILTEDRAAAETGSKMISTSNPVVPAVRAPKQKGAGDCLKLGTFDSSVLSTNDVFTELAWKVDVVNSCDQPFGVRVNFTIYDKDEFELDSDSEEVLVPAMGTGKARGKMLVSPPEKARRMTKQGASLSLR